MSDRVFHQDEARQKILAGAKILYDAVKTTMGPAGHNVVIGKGPTPTITHDGVKVARSIDIPVVDDATLGNKIGADLIKQAASKMNDVAGDGTTTVTVLTYHILNEANKLIAAGHNPMVIRRELEAVAKTAVESIEGEDITDNKKRLAEVAYISCGEKELGDLIADVIGKIGKDGVVTVEPSQEAQTSMNIVEGFTFDRGMQSPFFALNQAKLESSLISPAILIYTGKLYDMNELLPILEVLIKGQKPLIIFAEEVGSEILANLVLNKMKGTFISNVVVVPNFRKNLLSDISEATGATMFGADTGRALSTFAQDDLGYADKIVIGQDTTTIIGGQGEIETLLKDLKSQIKTVQNEYEKEVLQKRIASLQGKVAVISVGGLTEAEIDEKTYRVDDGVAAVKAALEEGIVPGGGVALLQISREIDDPSTGATVLRNALRQPFLILLENAGLNGDRYIDSISLGMGVDVRTGTIVHLMKNGIIDPAAVTKQAIQNAVSVAGTAMTIGALIAPIPEETHNEVG